MATVTKNEHILLIRLSSMGDVAMVVPVLRAFIAQYPYVKVTVLTRFFFSPFFKGMPNVTVFAPDLKGKHKGVVGLYKLSKALKTLNITAIADVHNVLRTQLIAMFLKGIKHSKIDKGRKEKKALVSGKLFKPLKTTHQRYADVFEKIGYPISLEAPVFPKPQILNKKAVALLRNTKQLKLVGVAPFAFYASKMYPLEQMKKVVEVLSKSYKVVLFGGGAKEIEQLAKLAKPFDNVVNLAGKLTLSEELVVISNLDIMLSMDSANSHIAAMLGVKVVTVWGVTHPYAGFTAFNQPEAHQLLANRTQFPLIPTSIYGNTYPENYKEAAGSVEPNVIVEKIKHLI